MADDAEKIAFIIDTQAQLAGIRQASSGISDFVGQVRTASGQMKIDLDTATAALNSLGIGAKLVGGNIAVAARDMASADAILKNLGSNARTTDAAVRQAAASTAGMAQAARAAAVGAQPLVDQTNRFGTASRASALAASRLTLVLDGMGGGVQGVARSVGTLSYGLADLGGPKMALFASGIAAGAVGLATLVEVMDRAHDSAVTVSEQLEKHISIESFANARAALKDTDTELAKLQQQLPDGWAKLERLGDTYARVTSGSLGFKEALTQIRQAATLTTAEEERYQFLLAKREAIQKQIATTGLDEAKSARERAIEFSAFYQSQSTALRSRTLATQATLNNDPLSAATATLSGSALAQEQAITKEFTKRNSETGQLIALTDKQRAQRDGLLSQLHQEVALQDQLLRQQNADRVAAATSRVEQAGAAAGSDLEGPAARLNALRIQDERDYTQEVGKEGVARSVAQATQLALDARGERDYYNTLRDAQTQYYLELDAARNKNDEKSYQMERVELERKLQDQVDQGLISTDQKKELMHQKDLRRAKDMASSAKSALLASTSAYAQYGGAVGKIMKSVNDGIRAGEIAANAAKDFGKGRSEAAAAIAAYASGNVGGGILHTAASAAFFGAAAFEATQAIGAVSGSGGGGGGGGGGAQNSRNSTFTPTDHGKGGNVNVIIQTVNPNDRSVIAATMFYLGQADVLKVPNLLPPSQGGYAVKNLSAGGSGYSLGHGFS